MNAKIEAENAECEEKIRITKQLTAATEKYLEAENAESEEKVRMLEEMFRQLTEAKKCLERSKSKD